MVMHTMRTNVMATLNGSQGSLVFGRDMFLNIPLIADWHAIAKHRAVLVNMALLHQNQKRWTYDYVAGQKVLKKVHDPTKIGLRTEGPFLVKQVHVNGTITMELREGVSERINIRRVMPYRIPT